MEDDQFDFSHGNALIRHYFQSEPDILSDQKWAERVNEALYLQYKQANIISEIISKTLSGNEH